MMVVNLAAAWQFTEDRQALFCKRKLYLRIGSSPLRRRFRACCVIRIVAVELRLLIVFFVKYFSLKKASEFPFFSKGFSLPSAGIMHPCA